MFETDELRDCGGGAGGGGGEGGAEGVGVEPECPHSLQCQSPARSEGEEREDELRV